MNREETLYRVAGWGNVVCAVLSLITALRGGLQGFSVWVTYAMAVAWAIAAAMNFHLLKEAVAKRQHPREQEERQQ